MTRQIDGGRVSFVCPCGNRAEGNSSDRLIKVGGASAVTQTDKYSTLLSNASFSRTMLRVEKECPKCGLPYMALVRVGDEETIILTCKCGHRETVRSS